MKLSLDTIGYGGYFTAPGEQLSLENAMRRAAAIGYDAVCVFAHRPLAFPPDISPSRRRAVRSLANELGLDFGAVVCCTNFQRGNHALLAPVEKELLYTRSAIDLAADLECGVVRVLSGFSGYFLNPHSENGYRWPAFESRSRRVSRAEDFLDAWHEVREALVELSRHAVERGVRLALQAHPEVTGNYTQVLEMIEQVGSEGLGVALDLPLLESSSDDHVRDTVARIGKRMIYSHTIAMRGVPLAGGGLAGWEEIAPGSSGDEMPWDVFLQACRDIGYDGVLSHDQGCPKFDQARRLQGIEAVDQRYREALIFFRNLLRPARPPREGRRCGRPRSWP
jgi:sugar phosphate isomerase/epimerase